jgi:DNA polymerase-3 subunit beta
MKLTVEREPLAEAIAAAGRALARNPQHTVMRGLLLEATTDGLAVSGYDYETSVRAVAPATVAEPGRALVSGRLLAAVVKPLGRKPVELAVTEAGVALSCGSARFRLPAMGVGDYPALPITGDVVGTVPAAVFAAAVATARVASDRGDGGVPGLTGVQLVATGEGTLTLYTTDRRRASRVRIPWSPGGGEPFAVLPPARAVADMLGALEAKADVTLSLARYDQAGAGLLGLADDRTRAATALLVDKFPATVDKLLDGEPVTVASARTEELRDAVARVVAVTDETNIVARLAWSSSGVEVDVVGAGDAYGSDTVDGTLDGPPIVHGVNARYLHEALASIERPRVLLAYTTAKAQVVLHGADDDGIDTDYAHMIAAMRLGN